MYVDTCLSYMDFCLVIHDHMSEGDNSEFLHINDFLKELLIFNLCLGDSCTF